MNRIWKEFQIGMPFEWILNDGYLRNDDDNFTGNYIFKILKRVVFI